MNNKEQSASNKWCKWYDMNSSNFYSIDIILMNYGTNRLPPDVPEICIIYKILVRKHVARWADHPPFGSFFRLLSSMVSNNPSHQTSQGCRFSWRQLDHPLVALYNIQDGSVCILNTHNTVVQGTKEVRPASNLSTATLSGHKNTNVSHQNILISSGQFRN